MPQSSVIVHGASWCPDAQRSKRLLDEKGVSYHWFDIDQNAESKAFVKEANHGETRIPVIVFPDDSILIEPSNAELEDKLAEFGM